MPTGIFFFGTPPPLPPLSLLVSSGASDGAAPPSCPMSLKETFFFAGSEVCFVAPALLASVCKDKPDRLLDYATEWMRTSYPAQATEAAAADVVCSWHPRTDVDDTQEGLMSYLSQTNATAILEGIIERAISAQPDNVTAYVIDELVALNPDVILPDDDDDGDDELEESEEDEVAAAEEEELLVEEEILMLEEEEVLVECGGLSTTSAGGWHLGQLPGKRVDDGGWFTDYLNRTDLPMRRKKPKAEYVLVRSTARRRCSLCSRARRSRRRCSSAASSPPVPSCTSRRCSRGRSSRPRTPPSRSRGSPLTSPPRRRETQPPR